MCELCSELLSVGDDKELGRIVVEPVEFAARALWLLSLPRGTPDGNQIPSTPSTIRVFPPGDSKPGCPTIVRTHSADYIYTLAKGRCETQGSTP